MFDWNHDGKIDYKDHAMDAYVYNEIQKENNQRRTPMQRTSGDGKFAIVIFSILIVVNIMMIFLVITSIPSLIMGNADAVFYEKYTHKFDTFMAVSFIVVVIKFLIFVCWLINRLVKKIK